MTIDYPCPTCGGDGPHTVIETGDEAVVVECNTDYCGEFEIRNEEFPS